MKLTFLGATRQVTGSLFLLETKKCKVLIDCGMFQGTDFNEARNHDDFAFDVKKIDAVILSHAHLDHTGRVPKLVHDGFRGAVYGTEGTLALAHLVWEDALAIMAYEHRKFGAPLLFHTDDLAPARHACRPIKYNEWIEVKGCVRFRLHDAGHIFGSSFVELSVEGKRLVFSGDLGNRNAPIVRDTQALPENVDILLVESTYGDRLHESHAKRKHIIKEAVETAVKRGGVVMIPAFSLERTQELIYELKQIIRENKGFPQVPIYIDSPLAIKALEVYRKHPEYYDAEAKLLKRMGGDFFKVPGLTMTLTRDESKMINSAKNPKVIIAGSGMMNGGRIVHHLSRYIEDPKSTVLIVGYQAEGTLGRRLYEGASEVNIMGVRKRVHAKVVAVGALSAHADQRKIIEWTTAPKHPPKQVFMIHGEPHAATELAHRLRDRMPVDTQIVVPEEGLCVEV